MSAPHALQEKVRVRVILDSLMQRLAKYFEVRHHVRYVHILFALPYACMYVHMCVLCTEVLSSFRLDVLNYCCVARQI